MSQSPKTTDTKLAFTSDKTLTTGEKIILSLACLPTNVGWALSESLIIPYLLMIGAPLYVCSWTWFFSPILSSYIAPKLDNLSDNWSETSNCWGWRGRKQLILSLTLIASITMILLPQSHSITYNLFNTNSIVLTFIIAMIIFTFMDLSFYLLLRPLQSLIWDISYGNKTIYMDTMKIFNIIQGICRMFGLIIVAICISFDFLFFGTHIGSAFTFSAIIIIISTFFSLFYSPNPPEIDTTLSHNTLPYSNTGFSSNLFANLDCENYSINTDEIKYLLNINTNKYDSIDVIHDMDMDMDTDDEYNTDEDDIDTITNNSNKYKALFILWLSQLCGWCSMCSIILFWTSFTSIDIYNGIANINNNNKQPFEWLQFKAGLVFGAYGLLLTSLVSVNCSVLYPWLRKYISIRILYLIAEIGMAVLCIVFYLIINQTLLLIFITMFGIFIQIHMQSCLELTEIELQPMFIKIRESKKKKYFQYILEICNVIAPVAVSLFGGPIVALCNGQFKYLWLFAGSIQLIFDAIVLLMFCNLFPWKLPPISTY